MTTTRTVVFDGRLSRGDSTGSAADARNSQFMTRTSMFLKKLTLLRSGRRVSMNDDMHSSIFTRNAHAIQLGNKAFNMSQPMLGTEMAQSIMDNEEHSDVSPTACSSPTSGSKKQPDPVASPPSNQPPPPAGLGIEITPRIGLPNGLSSVAQTVSPEQIDGLPSSGEPSWPRKSQIISETHALPDPAAIEAVSARSVVATTSAKSGLTDSDSQTSSDTFHDAMECWCGKSQCEHVSPSRTGTDAAPSSPGSASRVAESPVVSRERDSSRPVVRALQTVSQVSTTQSLPSRRLQPPNVSPAASTSNTKATPEITVTGSPAPSGGSATPRAMHPRLASLPPPMMARYTTQGSTRLTPSVFTRPTPMPIMNLPTLPPPTPPPPTSSAAQASPMRLRSMPALPHRGPSDAGMDLADHGNADLDDMDDLDDVEEEEEGHNSEDETSSPSLEMEVPLAGRRLNIPLPPSLSRGLRPELPAISVSPLNMPFATLTPGKAATGPTAQSSSAVANRTTQYFTPTEPHLAPDVAGSSVPSVRKSPALPMDYFTARIQDWPSAHDSTSSDPTRTPRPADFSTIAAPRTVPMPSSSPRPNLYHQASKSMIDLLSVSRKDKEREGASNTQENRKSHAPDYMLATTRDTPQPVAGPSSSAAAPHTHEERPATTLRRQRSLPMYTTATEPPPYPLFGPFKTQTPPIAPREEEGMEKLPKYKNSIYLAAIMPRKMEFSAPGFQSKDRKWKRALCVLEGTMFKVYKVHAGVVEDWWERTVGVGDKTVIDPGSVGVAGTIRVSAIRASERQLATRPCAQSKQDEASPLPDEDTPAQSSSSAAGPGMPPSRSRLALAASLLHPSRHSRDKNMPTGSASSSRQRLSMDTPQESSRIASATSPRRQSMDSARLSSPLASSSRTSNSSSDTSPPSTSTSMTSMSHQHSDESPATSHFSHLSTSTSCLEQEPEEKDLLRKYTLQNAESGLASDYLKRKNVIRVRMEGEQFLLQAKDVPAVIDWIEAIQAATNIALDLDERPMPKGPMFPRRRRRRRPRVDGQTAATGSNSNLASSSPSASRSTRA